MMLKNLRIIKFGDEKSTWNRIACTSHLLYKPVMKNILKAQNLQRLNMDGFAAEWHPR